VAKLRREIQDWPRDEDDAYIQPEKNSPLLEVTMNHNRMRYANQFNFADLWGFGSPHNYDHDGNYVCGTCNQIEAGDCELIEDIDADDIDPKASSCRHYEIICAGDPEVRLKRTTKAAALFGTAKNGEGFGCERCHWYRESKWKDSVGREGWCGNGYFTTDEKACCALNDAETIEEEGEGEGDNDSSMDKYIRLQSRK
jgi:hypothetical protein